MLQALASQNITPPPPELDSAHSIRVTLEFADIAFDECRADHMQGYGEVPPSLAPELNGMAGEMRRSVRKLITYLAQGLGQDLEGRIRRLEGALDEISLLQNLECIIKAHGLDLSVIPVSVETRSAHLTDEWFQAQILPLYGKHQDLARQSMRRKIGALREAVTAALKVRIELSGRGQQTRTAGFQLNDAFEAYGRLLDSWVRRSMAELQRRFEEHADVIRARMAPSASMGGANADQIEAIQRDLNSLEPPNAAPP